MKQRQRFTISYGYYESQIWGSFNQMAGCSQDILQGYGHLNAALELKDPLPRWLPHMVDALVLAFGERIPSRGLMEWPCNMAGGILRRKCSKTSRLKVQCPCDLVSEIEYWHFHHILFFRSKLLSLAHIQGDRNEDPSLKKK